MSQAKKKRKTENQEEGPAAGVDWPDGASDLYSEADDEWREAIMQRVYQRLHDQAQTKAQDNQTNNNQTNQDKARP